jgi:hypothetical protein
VTGEWRVMNISGELQTDRKRGLGFSALQPN